MRVHWVAVAAVAFGGCESLRQPAPAPQPGPRVAVQQPVIVTAAAVAPVPESPSAAEPDHLTLAAGCLERNDPASAAAHLEAYVRANPEQVMFRAQLAELFLKAGRDDAAKAHYERFVYDARTMTGPPRDYLVRAHTRLMDIARRADDAFGESFHRGAGLLTLVKEQDKDAERDEGFCEEMLCQAIRALGEAKERNPADPRVRLTLAEAYERAGNRRAAESERDAVRNGFTPGGSRITAGSSR